MAIDRAQVVGAALLLLDEYGLGDLSMRRIADELGVKAGAIYWHLPNKQTLLAAVADQIMAELAPVNPAGDPGPALADWCHGLRRVLLAHRDSADLVATALASGLCEVDPLVGVTAVLGRSRNDEEAAWGARALLHLVLGHVAEEQNVRLLAQFGASAAVAAVDQDRAFAHAVEALARGLVQP